MMNRRPKPYLPLYHVGSGECVVKRKEAVRLIAYLGSCVGVALVDAKNGVGGLIHLLLPEPINTEPTENILKYASSGLPYLLNQLLENGADRGSIRAVVAGGALVGIAQSLDLSLDIGGRIADRTTAFLESEGIPIERSETGGFFTCNLSLNAMDWSVEIKPCWHEIQDQEDMPHTPVFPTQRQLMARMEQIAPIPQVGLKILRMLEEGDHDFGPILSQIKQDQVISSRIIRDSNSVLLARNQPVESIAEAALVLGEERLATIVMTECFDRFYGQCKQGYSICRGGLFHHAVGTACLTEKIARLTGKAVPATAYTAGLVHDIGKVVLDQMITHALALFYRQMENSPRALNEVEMETFGTDHTRTGSLLAGLWRFPQRLVHAIRHHHDLESTDSQSLTSMVYLADLLVSRFQAGLEYEVIGAQKLDDCLASLQIDKGKVPLLVDLIPLPGRGVGR